MEEAKHSHPIIEGIMILPPEVEVPHLVAGKCLQCGRISFPKREICSNCFDSGKVEAIKLGHKGTLNTFTIVRRSLGPKKTPYAIGYIVTPENVRLLAPLTECNFDDLKIGIDMELVFEEEPGDEGNLAVVYKYRPMRSSRIQ